MCRRRVCVCVLIFRRYNIIENKYQTVLIQFYYLSIVKLASRYKV